MTSIDSFAPAVYPCAKAMIPPARPYVRIQKIMGCLYPLPLQTTSSDGVPLAGNISLPISKIDEKKRLKKALTTDVILKALSHQMSLIAKQQTEIQNKNAPENLEMEKNMELLRKVHEARIKEIRAQIAAEVQKLRGIIPRVSFKGGI